MQAVWRGAMVVPLGVSKMLWATQLRQINDQE
jgi:hypothetical protein